MNKQDFQNRINEIGSLEDAAQMRTQLAGLVDDVAAVFDSNEELAQQNQQFATDNETLRNANMDLFLRLGEQRTPEPPAPQPQEPLKLTFDALIDEKGNIK